MLSQSIISLGLRLGALELDRSREGTAFMKPLAVFVPREDYDSWARDGNPGWSWEEVLCVTYILSKYAFKLQGISLFPTEIKGRGDAIDLFFSQVKLAKQKYLHCLL